MQRTRLKHFRFLSAWTGAVFLLSATLASADDWPQWRGPRRDGVWRETGVVERFSAKQLDPVWRVPVGSGYCGPTVAHGRVYVADRQVDPKQIERVHCFDAATGKKVWSFEYDCPYTDVSYDAGPRGSISVDDGRAFALGTMGNLYAFDAATGQVRWQHDLNEEYRIRMPVWGISASPVVEKDLLIVQIGGDGACVVAFDKTDGREKWRALDDDASYAAPIVIDQAGRRVLVVYTGEAVVGLDPANGDVYWRYPFPAARMVIGIATPVVHRDFLFLSNFFDGSLLLKLGQDEPTIEKVWHRVGASEKKTDALQSLISTPYLKGDYIYGVDSYGELRCLELLTGKRVWESAKAVPRARWSTIHIVENRDKVWMFNERGELIIAKLSPSGYEEIDRTKLIEPTLDQLRKRGGVCWSHPAFANGHVFIRNDKELLCADLRATKR